AEVRLARLSAREARALGDLDTALARCEAARFALGDGNSDDFVEFELPWLMQAGRHEAAGRRAFLHLYDQETSSQAGALRIIHERLADPADTLIWWPLAALRACNLTSTLEHFIECGRGQDGEIVTRSPLHAQLFAAAGKLEGDALREAVFDAACAVLEQRAPGHPWFVRIASPLAGEFGRIDATTEAARLLSAIEQGGLNDRRSAYAQLNARRRSLGVERAMALPPPAPDGGYDCYALGCTLDDNDPWYEEIERLPGEDGSRVGFRKLRSLKARIYEHGRMQMERFAETGRGHPGDAGAHLYSMLCNNLAIIYRFDEQRYDEAIDLHQRGIAVSPFAEHYHGILNCRIAQGDHEATVAAGEQLWHFANEFGYSRHDVNEQCGEMLRALDQLGRHSEKLIWLQRLIEWQRGNDEDDARLSTDALHARVQCAFYLAGPYDEQARALWASLREQVEASDSPKVLSMTGDYMRAAGNKPEAVRFYDRLLEVNPHSPDPILFDDDSIPRLLAKMDARAEADTNTPAAPAAAGAAGKRAWWKFWQ
ncbi:tetratricopeptide repeat protein, partial [Burkholderia sp. Ac-20379]|nr:tetratricopeptide repeat protein [Burkholderia sp. Ac-20379]